MGTVLLLALLGLAAWGVATYNGLVSMRNRTDNAWKQIGVQLRRRHDLIPNLVEAVKGAMEYERDTLERVMAARAKAVAATGTAESAAAEGALTQSLGRLLAVMENYPQLKASQNVLRLQEELTTTENQIAFARQFYNDSVTAYNTRQQTFPGNLVASNFGFQPADLFTAMEPDAPPPSIDLRLPPRA